MNSILKEVLEKISLSDEKLADLKQKIDEFVKELKEDLNEKRIDAEIFVGGSFAKNTVIKKDYYDADIFIRFEQKYNGKISEITGKLLEGRKDFDLIHGSRDYFRINLDEDFFVELIPVIKIKTPKEAENITDLSYSHVIYINKKVKSKKIIDDIRLAKAFCYANKCYGAESYIRGFSGYALELLIYYYGSFLKFIKSIIKIKEKLVIDIEKNYRNKKEILIDMNSSKLISPIILIDPTYKQRNALAALSYESFQKFQKACADFLKKPSVESFEIKKTDLEKIKKDAERKKEEFALIEANTNKQEGDIAGSKLLKFYNHLNEEISKFFEISNKGFNYNGKKAARYFFVAKPKKEILVSGPNIKDKENVRAFEKVHKNYFTKKGRIYAKETVIISLKKFVEKWKNKNARKIKEMSVSELKILE